MKKYLSTLHKRSPAHKKHFALVVSGGATLIIFGIWSMVVFGNSNAVVANQTSNDSNTVVATDNTNAVSPFDDVKGGVANSIDAIKQQFNQITQTVGSLNVQDKYQEVRNQALTN